MPARLHEIDSTIAHSFNPPKDLDLKQLSKKNNIKIAELVRKALLEYIDRHGLTA